MKVLPNMGGAVGTISKVARGELLLAIRSRYGESRREEKGRILDELVSLMGCHRKHVIRLLGRKLAMTDGGGSQGRRVYDEAVREALVVLWEASDRICGKRLVHVLPTLLASLEGHGHLQLEDGVRARLLRVSASTIDRLLSSVRERGHGRGKRRRSASKPSRAISTRTSEEWQDPLPGYLEIDLVAHGGGAMAGVFIHSLVATDVASGWTESVVLLAREQSLVVEGLEVIRRRLPITLLGIDSDNDSAFINDTLLSYCQERNLEFTRSRAYRKNDQAWIEQKNGAVIRRFVGHARFAGVVAGRSLAYLYDQLRLYVNYFQPSFKLREKSRIGSRVRKRYYKPATPCERLLEHGLVGADRKLALEEERQSLDPVELLHRLREGQSALAVLVSEEPAAGPERQSLEEFLGKLPILWQSGDARPTHRRKEVKRRYWRTRIDPFERVWPEVLLWLQASPDATAKSLFGRLQKEHPGQFADGQLRTLQRRVRDWRHVMARKLVYSCLEQPVSPRNCSEATTPGVTGNGAP